MPLARLHPGVDEVIPVATRRWRHGLLQPETGARFRLSGQVRAIGAQIVIDTQGLVRSAMIARSSGGVRHGYDRVSIREKPAALFYDVTHRVSRSLHAVTRNRTLTGLSLGYSPEWPVDYGLERPMPDKRSRYALLFHGTSRADKEWTDTESIEIGQWLAGQGLDFLPWGNEREQTRCRYLAKEISGARNPGLPIDRRSRQDGGRGLRRGRRRHRATSACGSVRSAAGRDFPVNAALPHRPDRQRPDFDVWRERSFNHGQAGDRGIRAAPRIAATVSADACRRPQIEARPAAITQR